MESNPSQGTLNLSSDEMEKIANDHLDSQKKKSVSSQVCIYLCNRVSREKFTNKSLCEEIGITDEREINAASAMLSKLASHKHKVLKVVAKTGTTKGSRGQFIYEIIAITQMPNYRAYASKGGSIGRTWSKSEPLKNLPLSDEFKGSTSMNQGPIKTFSDLKASLGSKEYSVKLSDLSKIPEIKATIPEKDWEEQMKDQIKKEAVIPENDEFEGVNTTIQILELLKSNSTGEIAESAIKLLDVAEAQKRMMEQIQKGAAEIELALHHAAVSLHNISNLKIELSSLSVDQLLKALRAKYREQEASNPLTPAS